MKLLIALLTFMFSVTAFAVPTTLTVQSIGETALLVVYADAEVNDHNKFSNVDQSFFLHVKNPGVSSATATVSAQTTSFTDSVLGAITKSSITISLSAGEEKFAGPFKGKVYNDSNDDVIITYSGAGAADIDIAVLKAPK